MAGREAYLAGLELLAEDDLEGALAQLSKAVDAEADNADYLVKRAVVLAKQRDWARSLSDAENAIQLRPESVQAQLRKGIADFHLDNFAASHAALQEALRICGADDTTTASTAQTWLRKCELELEELRASEPAPSEPAPSEPAPSEPAVPPAPAKPSAFPFDWYQSFTHVTVEIEAKGVSAERVKHDISSTSVTVDISLESGDAIFSYDWDLFAEIDPAQSALTVHPRMIELRLRKVNKDLQWPALEAAAGASAHSAAGEPAAAASSSSSSSSKPLPAPYAGGKNWDAIAKEVDAEEDKPEGDEALNKLFKDIYKNANEDTRRAMVKSFQTSGGTVLSTNWGEVAAKDYESDRPAPKGMEWRNWEGDKLDVDKSSDKYDD